MLNSFFFFNDTATTEIYTLSLHDALPIYDGQRALEMELTLHAPGDRPELLPDHALPLRVVARDHERRLLRLAQRHHLGLSAGAALQVEPDPHRLRQADRRLGIHDQRHGAVRSA